MNQPQCKYFDCAFGSIANRNNVMTAAEFKAKMPEDKREIYMTWHRFPEMYLTYWQNNKNSNGNNTISGYDGTSYADFLPLDFDGEDLSQIHTQVKEFIQRLEVSLDVDDGIRIYFSGSKGFHVLLDATLFGGWVPSPKLAVNLRSLAKRLMGEQPFDSAIYDKNRLLRFPNSIHAKTGCYKIPLSKAEMFSWSIDKIIAEAQAPRDIQFATWGDCSTSGALKEIWQEVTSKKPKKVKTDNNFVLFPRNMTEGEGRDNAAFNIARYCRKRNWPEERTLELLEMWDSLQVDPLGINELETKIRSTYRQGDESIEDNDLLTPEQLAERYQDHIEKLKGRKISLGLPAIDERIRSVVPGEVCTLMARSGVGKTMLAQNVISNIARGNAEILSVFASLEQPDSMCFERYAQMATGNGGSEIERAWSDSDIAKEGIIQSVKDMLGEKTLTYVKPASLDILGNLVERAGAMVGQPVDVLVIDYLGMINGEGMGRGLYEQISNIARALKSFAKQYDLSIILLCQVSRGPGEDGNVPLTKSSARESGAVEESADILLGLYRPFLNMVDNDGQNLDNKINIQILKNRKGPEGETYEYDLDRRSLRITGWGTKPVAL